MARPIPKRLAKEPLVEALFEIRFSSNKPGAVGQLLPGLVYKALGKRYGDPVSLPLATMPAAEMDKHQDLRYRPTVRMDDNPFSIQTGPRVVSLNCRRPYAGWHTFSERILELATVLRETALLTTPERFSLRYIDLLELDGSPSLDSLNVSIDVHGERLSNHPLYFRTELLRDDFHHIVLIALPAELKNEETEIHRGIWVDVDTLCPAEEDFWKTLPERIGAAHDAAKRVFFDLLTEQTLAQLQPEYS